MRNFYEVALKWTEPFYVMDSKITFRNLFLIKQNQVAYIYLK